MISPTPLDRIRQALDQDSRIRAEATEGPWDVYAHFYVGRTRKVGGFNAYNASQTVDGDQPDALFIAHARNVDLGSALRVAVEALERVGNEGDPLIAIDALDRIAGLLPGETK